LLREAERIDLNHPLLPTRRPHLRHFTEENTMKLIHDLFSTDYGIMSISGIVFMLGMGVFFVKFFTNKMNESAAKDAK
jgi:hypothetical protein